MRSSWSYLVKAFCFSALCLLAAGVVACNAPAVCDIQFEDEARSEACTVGSSLVAPHLIDLDRSILTRPGVVQARCIQGCESQSYIMDRQNLVTTDDPAEYGAATVEGASLAQICVTACRSRIRYEASENP